MKSVGATLMFFAMAMADDCGSSAPTSDTIQQQRQEKITRDAIESVGMPAIHNYRELRMAKEIQELRDRHDVVSYTYLYAEASGKLTFLCESSGYGLPYSTQFTSPQKIAASGHQYGYAILPQAEPNGLFSPQSSEGTWVMCKDPNGPDVKPVYVEAKVITSPWKYNVDSATVR